MRESIQLPEHVAKNRAAAAAETRDVDNVDVDASGNDELSGRLQAACPLNQLGIT